MFTDRSKSAPLDYGARPGTVGVAVGCPTGVAVFGGGTNVGRRVGGGPLLVAVGCGTVGSTIGVWTVGEVAVTVAVEVADGVYVAPGVTVGSVGNGVYVSSGVGVAKGVNVKLGVAVGRGVPNVGDGVGVEVCSGVAV